MAALVPVIGIPATLCGLYYSYKITFNTTTLLIQKNESESSTIGSVIGTGSVYVLSSAIAIVNSRKSQPIQGTERAPFTAGQFLRGSRNLIIVGVCVWLASAVGGGIGNVAFGKIYPKDTSKPKVKFSSKNL